jgi:hypothetical protein
MYSYTKALSSGINLLQSKDICADIVSYKENIKLNYYEGMTVTNCKLLGKTTARAQCNLQQTEHMQDT